MAVVVERGASGKPEFKISPELKLQGLAFQTAQALNHPENRQGATYSVSEYRAPTTHYAEVKGAEQTSNGRTLRLRIGFTALSEGGTRVAVERFTVTSVMPGIRVEGNPLTFDNPTIIVGEDVLHLAQQDTDGNLLITSIGRDGRSHELAPDSSQK